MNYEELTGDEWCNLLQRHPQHAKHCRWELFDGDCWDRLLRRRPQFAEHCDWDKLGIVDWCWLLNEQPQFADKCDWHRFNEQNWTWINQHPEKEFMGLITEHEKKRVIMSSKYALACFADPSEDLIRLHKLKHEL